MHEDSVRFLRSIVNLVPDELTPLEGYKNYVELTYH